MATFASSIPLRGLAAATPFKRIPTALAYNFNTEVRAYTPSFQRPAFILSVPACLSFLPGPGCGLDFLCSGVCL